MRGEDNECVVVEGGEGRVEREEDDMCVEIGVLGRENRSKRRVQSV